MQTSNFNLQTIDTKRLEQHISASILAKSNITIIGKRGTGKTAISKQRIKNADHIEAYMNLSVFERSDFGYPKLFNQDKENGEEQFVQYMLPQIFRSMLYGNKPVVLLLDEVDKAEREVWAPLLELTHERSIGGRPLPNLACCIMTGNLISEGGARPTPPLLDRSEAYLLEPNAQYWLEWAASVPNEIHPSIYRWVADHSKVLLGEEDDGENYKGTSPRGCHLASKMLFVGEANGWKTDLLYEKVSGYLGKKNGIDFKIYYQNFRTLLPIADAIFSDRSYKEEFNVLLPTEKLYCSTIVCSRFANSLDQSSPDNPPESIRQVGQFMQICGYENVLASMRSQIRSERILKFGLIENEHWKGILERINKKVSGAV